jgi:23S rRNA (uracil1939-C5)-methyltransferase
MKRFHKPRKKALPNPVRVTIEKFSHDGRGLARLDGRVILVDNAVPGEACQVRINQANTKLWQGAAIKRELDGAARSRPACHVYQQCGGCQLQHVNHQSQLALKQSAVQELFQRRQVEVNHWMAPLVSSPYHYRHRARLHLSGKGEVGFHAAAQNQVVSFEYCPILVPELHKLVEQLRTDAPLAGVSQLELVVDDYQQPGIKVLKASDSGRELMENWALQQGWSVNHSLKYRSAKVNVSARPGDFTQVNRGINQAMLSQASEWLQLTKDDRLLDLFCGNGNLGLAMASQVASVLGYEVGGEAVKQAGLAAQQAALPAQFFEKDLFTAVLDEEGRLMQFAPSCAVLDPPRAGAQHVCEQLTSVISLQRILYISCDPATLARDLQVLGQGHWRVVRAGLLDMFPQTRHIETMVLLEKQTGKNL